MNTIDMYIYIAERYNKYTIRECFGGIPIHRFGFRGILNQSIGLMYYLVLLNYVFGGFSLLMFSVGEGKKGIKMEKVY